MSVFKASSFLIALFMAAPALAQQRPAPAPQPLRGYLIAGGGASTSTPKTAMTVNGEVAENVARNLQVYLSAAYYDNVMSQAAIDQLAQVGAALTAVTGTPWVFHGRDRGRSFTVGAKFLPAAGASVHPYIGGGLGAINLRRTIREQSRGNITEAYLAEFGSPDSFVDSTQSNTTHPMAEVAAGVGVAVRRAYIDFGYRYRRGFHSVDTFDVSQIGVSAGLKF